MDAAETAGGRHWGTDAGAGPASCSRAIASVGCPAGPSWSGLAPCRRSDGAPSAGAAANAIARSAIVVATRSRARGCSRYTGLPSPTEKRRATTAFCGLVRPPRCGLVSRWRPADQPRLVGHRSLRPRGSRR